MRKAGLLVESMVEAAAHITTHTALAAWTNGLTNPMIGPFLSNAP